MVKLPTDPNPKRRRSSQSQSPSQSPSQVAPTENQEENLPPSRRRQGKLESPSSSNSSKKTTLVSLPNPSPNSNPTTNSVVSTENHMENVTVTSKRKQVLPSPSSVSSPDTKTQMRLRQRSSPMLTKHTCTASSSPNPSSSTTQKRKPPPSSSTPIIEIETIPNAKPNHEVIVIRDDSPSPAKRKKRKTPSFTCPLCFWVKKDEDRFNIMGCDHFYCRDCIEKYVSSKLENNMVVIGCPELGCGGKLEVESCREVLSRGTLDWWGDALCESLIEASQKFYCPFKDCSALLMNDGGEVVMESECPNCRRLFCAQCKVPWHAEIKCEEFQWLKKEAKDDKEMKKLAEKEQWTRCPSCNFYVQKISGCNFMKCRCGAEFCYLCGKSPMTDHYCQYCKR